MTQAEALELMASLAAAFPRQQISERTAEVYVHDLLHLPLETAGPAVEQVRRTSDYFPSIAAILEAAARLQLQAPTVMKAWEQARGPRHDRHELVHSARRIVGDDHTWRNSPASDLRPAFIAAYKEVVADATQAIVAPIPVPLLDRARGRLAELERPESDA